MLYPATLIPTANGKYDVAFADLPGCFSQGDDLEKALACAREALSFHLSGLLRDGDPIPPPSNLEEARAKEEAVSAEDGDTLPEGTVFQYVSAEPKTKESSLVRLSVSLKQPVIDRIDAMADDLGLTRSGLIAVATQDYISRMRG